MKKVKSIMLKILAVVISLSSFWIMAVGNFTTLFIVIGTIVLTVGVTIYIMSNPKTYNSSVSSVRQIENTRNLKIEDIYEAFKGMDSTMGTPWLGKINPGKMKAMFFGPTEEGNYIYVNKMFGSFYVSMNFITSFIIAPPSEVWRLEKPHKPKDIFDDEELVCYSLLNHDMVDDVYRVIDKFMQTGEVTAFANENNLGKIYRFNEDFRWTGQNFTISDFDGNPIYNVEGTMPLKTFYVRDAKTGEEVFKMTKRLLHVLNHYDFYMHGEEYGSFEQKIDFFHDTFTMETRDGTLEMKSINDMIGTNYIVKLNGKAIGSIAERFTLSLHNIVFDNFIVHVRDDKHVALMAGFAVMAARELRRDQTQSI